MDFLFAIRKLDGNIKKLLFFKGEKDRNRYNGNIRTPHKSWKSTYVCRSKYKKLLMVPESLLHRSSTRGLMKNYVYFELKLFEKWKFIFLS